jgi:hypothetical protein
MAEAIAEAEAKEAWEEFEGHLNQAGLYVMGTNEGRTVCGNKFFL